MTDTETLNELGPTTKAVVVASGQVRQIADVLLHFRDKIGDDQYAEIVEQIERVFSAAQRGTGLTCYTYDNDMVLVNLVSTVAAYCGCEVEDNDEEVTFSFGSARINIRYTTNDSAGKPCAAILVNE